MESRAGGCGKSLLLGSLEVPLLPLGRAGKDASCVVLIRPGVGAQVVAGLLARSGQLLCSTGDRGKAVAPSTLRRAAYPDRNPGW